MDQKAVFSVFLFNCSQFFFLTVHVASRCWIYPAFIYRTAFNGGWWEISISTWIRIDLRCFPLITRQVLFLFILFSFVFLVDIDFFSEVSTAVLAGFVFFFWFSFLQRVLLCCFSSTSWPIQFQAGDCVFSYFSSEIFDSLYGWSARRALVDGLLFAFHFSRTLGFNSVKAA